MAAQPYPFNQKPAATSVLAQTFEGVPDGMNLALPAHEIADTQARILVDWLVDQPGITRQRGPVTPVGGGIPALPRPASGIFATLNPLGVAKYATLTGDATHGYFTVLADNGASWIDIAAGTNFQAVSPYMMVDAKAAVGGGCMIGFSNEYTSDSSIVQGIAYWFGANKVNWTGTVTTTRGSTAVTAASGFSTNVCPGMFLFANTDDPYTSAYIGIVKSVNSDTSLTLISPSPFTATAKSGTFQSFRGIAPRVTVGEITTDVTTTTVTGGNTKFISQGLNAGTWQIYRQSDFAFVGKVSAVVTEISLTLAANAAVAMANEPYVAIRVDADFTIAEPTSLSKVGFLNASYADRQWYANRGSGPNDNMTVWFSDAAQSEALDLSAFSGNWFEITSSTSVNEPVRALAAAYNGLLIFKETETFIIGGSSPDSFDVKKLEDDGVLSGMSVQEFGGGVIWAGREGIDFYDGVQVTNLVEGTLGQVWKDTVRTFDPNTYRMWSMVNRDHYFLFLENITPSFSIIKGNLSTTPSRLTIVINMVTRAVTLATNLDIRGSTIVPATATKHAWFIVNDASVGHVCDADALFTATGVDAITCAGNSLGPQIYFESKRFDAGDGMRLKRWKMIAMNYLSSGGSLVVDTVLGLNDIGQVATTSFPSSLPSWSSMSANITSWTAMKEQYPTWQFVIQSVFLPARIRMQKKSQFMAFRLYGSVSGLSDAQLGPYSVAFKLQRVGRV